MGVKLGEICKFQSGGTPAKGNAEYFNGKIPWITTIALNGGNIDESNAVDWITEKAIMESAAKIVPAFSVMVGTRVGVGKVAINTVDMSTSQDIISLIGIDENIWNKEYLCKFLQGKNRYLNSKARGATIKGIKIDVLSSLELPDISLEEQQRISSIIDVMKNIISSYQYELQKLDELIKSRFVEMFGDPIINKKGFIKDEMGNYMTVLTDFNSNGSYKTLDSGVTMYDEPNYAWMVRTTDLESGDMTSIKYIDKRAYELLSKSKIFGNEIIMNKIGSAGKIYLMPKIAMPASLGRNAFMFRFDERINVVFLFYLLTSDYGQREIQQYVRGAVTKTITKNDARSVLIIVPPIELQNQFANFVAQVDKSKLTLCRYNINVNK